MPILNENISGSSKGNVWEHKSLWETLLQNLCWRRRDEIKMKIFGPLNGNNDLKCALDVSTTFHSYVLGGWYRCHNNADGNKVATHECTLLVLSKKQTTIFPLEISHLKTANLCTHSVTFFLEGCTRECVAHILMREFRWSCCLLCGTEVLACEPTLGM